MQPINPHVISKIIRTMWMILVLYWILSAFGNKKTRIRQSRRSRLAYFIVLAATGYCLSSLVNIRFQVFPINVVTQVTGTILCAIGLGFSIWARRILGRNWSGFVMIKEDHELVERGPYRFVRHPIYTGLITALTGTITALMPTVFGFIIVVVWLLAFYFKAKHEEHLMTQEFGEAYNQYKCRVKAALIPFLC